MMEFLRGFDAFTMAFMVAVLFLSLSANLVYTALYRRTYSGFGSMDPDSAEEEKNEDDLTDAEIEAQLEPIR